MKIFCTRFFADLVPMRAASLTFATLLSIVPLMIFIFYVLSFFPQLKNTDNMIEQFVLVHFVPASAVVVSRALDTFLVNMHTLSWLSGGLLASVGLLLLFNIAAAVNGVWHVKMTGSSVLTLCFYFFVSLIMLIVLAFLLLLSSYFTSLSQVARVAQLVFVKKLLFYFFPCLIEWVTFSLFHWMMPSCRVRFNYALIAGFITMILFEISKWGFVQYLHYFPAYQIIYGVLAGIPIFFLWIFLTWLIVISGALLCSLLQDSYFLK